MLAINVATDNPNYKSVSGNLYSKDGTVLMQYAIGKKGSFTIPSQVTVGSLNAFEGVDESIFNVYSNAYYLGDGNNQYAYLISAINQQITSCIINENTKYITDYAFSYCYNLQSITIPSAVKAIGYRAFYQCNNFWNWHIKEQKELMN